MAAKRNQRRRRPIRPIILIPCVLLVILSAVLVGIYLFPEKKSNILEKAEATVSFVSSRDARICCIGNRIISLNSAGYSLYDLSGATDGFISYPLSDPTVCTCENGLLAYGPGSSKAFYLGSGNSREAISAPGNIIYASLCNKKGFAIVSDSRFCKGELTLYDLKGNILFSYKCTEGFPYLCAISPDLSLIACAVLRQSESGIPATSIYTFSPDREEIEGKLDLEGTVINGLACSESERITAVTDRGVLTANAKGEELSRYELSNETVLFYSIPDGYTFLYTYRQDAGEKYGLVTVDPDGNEIARSSVSDSYIAVSGNGSHVALLSDRFVTVYDRSLTPICVVPHKYAVTGIFLCENNKLLCRTDSGASIYKY